MERRATHLGTASLGTARPWALGGCAAAVLSIMGCTGTPRSSAPPADAGDAGGEDAGDTGIDGHADGSRDAASETTPSLAHALEALGYTTRAGAFAPVDLTSCCVDGGSCYNSNPASPYLAFFAPEAPGQTVPNTGAVLGTESADAGLTSVWRLDEGEALVYVGPTPPTASYFGFTPYLFDRARDGGARNVLFAALSPSANNLRFRVAGDASVYDAPTVVVAAADARTRDDVASALATAGIEPGSSNVVVFDPMLAHFGIGGGADTFAVLFRVAEFAASEATKGAAWVNEPHGILLRASPEHARAPTPLSPAVRTPSTSPTERTASLQASVVALEAAVLSRYSSMKATALPVVDVPSVPAQCIATGTSCGGANPDGDYPYSSIDLWPSDDRVFYVVYGVNHAKTGKTVFSGFDVIAVDHLVGVAARTTGQYAGSASFFVPSDPNAALLYACVVARSCSSAPAGECCVAVPDGACPGGLAAGAAFAYTFRAYLEPSSDTAPSPATLLPENVLKLAP